jgi:hypothetical protein
LLGEFGPGEVTGGNKVDRGVGNIDDEEISSS